MSSSLRALLQGIIDYAGLFPPAKLPLERAIRQYAKYRRNPDRWLLGRFIVPAARLVELAPLDDLFHVQPPFFFSVLGRGGETGDEFLQNLELDLAEIATFRETHFGRVEVDVLEAKLPNEITQPGSYQMSYYTLVRAAQTMERLGPPQLKAYLEITPTADWRTSFALTHDLLRALARFQETRIQGPFRRFQAAGFKLRCGGPNAAAFPTPEQVAMVLVSCRHNGLAFKATAGLHHPIRRFNHGLQTSMHGFLNLFGAAVLGSVHGLDEKTVERMIADEDARNFKFTDTGFRWRDWWASTDEVAAVRQQHAIAFGSCSFDEPREDLRALKLL